MSTIRNKNIYICDNFSIDELVYPEIYELYKYHDKLSELWGLFDKHSTIAIDNLRDFINGSVVINDWSWGGNFKESGLRNVNTKTGAALSTHKIGSGFDLKFNTSTWNPESLREYMRDIGCFKPGFLNRNDREAKPFLKITRIEWLNNMSWFHLDNSVHINTDRSIRILYG